MEEIQKFDPATLMQGVKDRIKSTFVSLIPDEQWDQMCQKEIDIFFSYRPALDNWNRKTEPSRTEFEKIVDQMLTDKARQEIVKFLDGEDFQVTWETNGKPVLSAAMKKLIVDNAGEILVNIMTQPFSNIISNIRYEIQNPGQR